MKGSMPLIEDVVLTTYGTNTLLDNLRNVNAKEREAHPNIAHALEEVVALAVKKLEEKKSSRSGRPNVELTFAEVSGALRHSLETQPLGEEESTRAQTLLTRSFWEAARTELRAEKQKEVDKAREPYILSFLPFAAYLKSDKLDQMSGLTFNQNDGVKPLRPEGLREVLQALRTKAERIDAIVSRVEVGGQAAAKDLIKDDADKRVAQQAATGNPNERFKMSRVLAENVGMHPEHIMVYNQSTIPGAVSSALRNIADRLEERIDSIDDILDPRDKTRWSWEELKKQVVKPAIAEVREERIDLGAYNAHDHGMLTAVVGIAGKAFIQALAKQKAGGFTRGKAEDKKSDGAS